jgi:hypothetical protein
MKPLIQFAVRQTMIDRVRFKKKKKKQTKTQPKFSNYASKRRQINTRERVGLEERIDFAEMI